MNKIIFLLLTSILTPLVLDACPDCIGYTEMNPETGVEHNGPLRNLHCVCECAKFDRSDDNRCTNCLHHQAGKPAAVTIEVQED